MHTMSVTVRGGGISLASMQHARQKKQAEKGLNRSCNYRPYSEYGDECGSGLPRKFTFPLLLYSSCAKLPPFIPIKIDFTSDRIDLSNEKIPLLVVRERCFFF